jgi:hypothetical protein
MKTAVRPQRSTATLVVLAVRVITLSIHFLSLSLEDASRLSTLTGLMSVRRHTDPPFPLYCSDIGQFRRSLRCLSALPLSGLHLELHFPWGLSRHLQGHLPASNFENGMNPAVLGVTTLSISASDDKGNQPMALVSLFNTLKGVKD